MTAAGDVGCGTRTDRYVLQKHVFSFGREEILPQNLKKTDKIDCQSPRAKLEIGKLRSPVLTGRHKQRDYLALAQMAKRARKQVNGVLLQALRGAFWKSVRRRL